MTSPDSRTLPQRGQSLADQVMNYVRHSVSTGEMQTGRLYSIYQLAETWAFRARRSAKDCCVLRKLA